MPAYEPTANPLDWSNSTGTQYAITQVAWLDGRTIAPGATDESLRNKPNRMADVVFPSKKGYVIENPGFCVRGPNVYFDINIAASTQSYRVSTAMFDGSVSRRRMIDGRRPSVGMPFLYTDGGVAGRDIE
jgi:hypothetical protein